MPNQIIPFSRKKLIRSAVGSLVFVAAGIWMLKLSLNPPTEGFVIFRSPLFLQLVGGASVLFFGLTAVIFLKKLFSNTPALMISKEGIFDNSSGISAGMIPWSDIDDITEKEVAG